MIVVVVWVASFKPALSQTSECGTQLPRNDTDLGSGFGLFGDGGDGGLGFRSGGGGAVIEGVVAEIVRSVECVDALVALYEQKPFEETAALIVQEIFVPLAFGEFGNDDEDAAIGLLSGELKNVLNDRHDDEAIWRWEAD